MHWLSSLWWRLIRFGFYLLYNQLAFTYDLVSKIVSLGSWRCWQRAALKHLHVDTDALVLELAHGTGDLQIDLKNAGYLTIGYDFSPHMGGIAQRKLHRNNLDAVLVRGKAQQLPFATAQFAIVVTTFPTDFIVQPETLDEIHRILTNDGRLVIVSSGMFTGRGILKTLLEWLYRVTGQRRQEVAEHVMSIFEAHGFKVSYFTEQCSQSVAQVIILQK